jgi:hypothetical protein
VLAVGSSMVFSLGSLPLVLSTGTVVTAIGGWFFQFFGRRDYYSRAYFSKVHARLSREKKQKLTKLKKELQQVESTSGIKQLELLEAKYRNFEEILSSKLSPTEMTYSRYLSMAEQVYLAVLDNLDKVFLTLKSISAVDKEHLTQRVAILEKDNASIAEKEKETLNKRLNLYQQQQNRAAEIILANERALTELDEVSAKMASVQMNKGRAEFDLNIAMEELRNLAERTDQYAR